MNKRNPKEKFKSKIGGQALIEGIMMRGINKAAMACRLPDGSIDVEEWDVVSGGKNAPWYKKMPFVRGSINFVTSLIDGYKCLTKSAEKQGDFKDEELSKFEKKLLDIFGDKLMPILSVISVLIGVLVCFGLFMFLPMLITKLMGDFLPNQFVKTLVEGLIKIVLFIAYLALVSKMKDIQRTFEYHGAEHKTIACYESGEELIPENVKKFTRFHPRCGTSFLIIVLIVSILVFSVVTWQTMWQRIVLKLLLLPVVCGIAYEIIRLAGNYDNVFTRIISAPGLALQRLTTREPDERQIECAIAALKPCIPKDKEEDKW
ncbi:MAG TPA: DUF1385 domain-containing protein [Oscillospiraceae bacterium]|nr:DUF1385 domain-containing protein [Oscillospiraceae bacterium]